MPKVFYTKVWNHFVFDLDLLFINNPLGLWICTVASIIKISCCISRVFSISISLIANQPVAGSIIVFAGKMHFYLITFTGCNGVGTNSVYLHYVPRNDILLPILLRMRFLILAPLVCTCYVKCLMWREYFSVFVMYYYHICWRPVVFSIVISLRPMVVSVLYLLKTCGLCYILAQDCWSFALLWMICSSLVY